MSRVWPIGALALCLGACEVPVDSGFEYALSGGDPAAGPGDLGRVPVHEAWMAPPYRSTPHESAGFLLLEDSPLKPWCGGVLVAPDVVVTSSDCTSGIRTSAISVGFDVPNQGGEYAVEDVVALERDSRLAALVLDEPVAGIEPADVAPLQRDLCGVQSVSFLYVLEEDPSARWLWSGCFTHVDQMLEPLSGEPNCHGDAGAGAFTGRGALVGVVVAAEGASPCVHRLQLAVPTPGGPFEEALELSR